MVTFEHILFIDLPLMNSQYQRKYSDNSTNIGKKALKLVNTSRTTPTNNKIVVQLNISSDHLCIKVTF